MVLVVSWGGPVAFSASVFGMVVEHVTCLRAPMACNILSSFAFSIPLDSYLVILNEGRERYAHHDIPALPFADDILLQ